MFVVAGRECQRADWNRHKVACKKAKAAAKVAVAVAAVAKATEAVASDSSGGDTALLQSTRRKMKN